MRRTGFFLMGNTCTRLVTKSWYVQAFSSAVTSSAFPKPAATSQTSPDNNNHELDSAPRDKAQHYPPAPNCIPTSVHTNHDPQQVKEVIDVAMTKEGEAIKFPGHDLTASVLQSDTENVKDFYTVERKLGQGQLVTDPCAEKSTGKEFACKLIAKRKLISMEDVDDVQRELCIMHHLSGHPNIVTIKGAYEDVTSVHLVMELCAGGELFDRIIQRGHYSETKAAELTRAIVGVIEACHALGVIHRDLKPENFLFSNQGEDAALKTTDLGLSIFFKPGEIFTGVMGSPYYVAPEVLRKKNGPEADVWSAGVILYIQLSGVPPFWAQTEQGIFEQVLKSELDFVSDSWPKIAESAKDLLQRTLNPNAAKRSKAHQVLCHPWICEDGVAPDRPSHSAVQTRLKNFSVTNKLKKMVVHVIAESLSEEEIAGLKEMFKMMDSDDSGSISFEELKEGLKKVGSNLMEEDIHQLMDAADVDQNGKINYGEFFAATLNLNKIEQEENLFRAFSCKSGYRTTDELQQACSDFHMGGYVCRGSHL